jgi:hypothetical protein
MYYISREQSFRNWPSQLVQKPKELIQKGFFYTDIGDRGKCFYWGVTLKPGAGPGGGAHPAGAPPPPKIGNLVFGRVVMASF